MPGLSSRDGTGLVTPNQLRGGGFAAADRSSPLAQASVLQGGWWARQGDATASAGAGDGGGGEALDGCAAGGDLRGELPDERSELRAVSRAGRHEGDAVRDPSRIAGGRDDAVLASIPSTSQCSRLVPDLVPTTTRRAPKQAPRRLGTRHSRQSRRGGGRDRRLLPALSLPGPVDPRLSGIVGDRAFLGVTPAVTPWNSLAVAKS